MALPFELRCLGRPALFGPDGSLVRLRVKKHLALLAYFALEPKEPHRRDTLSDLLWSQSPMSDARHSLATAVSVIRGLLGPSSIESTRDTVRFACSWLIADVERLAENNPREETALPATRIEELLLDLELPDAPEFHLWRDRLRARWRPTMQAELLRQMEVARRCGSWRELDHIGDRLIALEELNEHGIRAHMEAAALSGDRVGALMAYEQWRARLGSELSAIPSPLMQRFADQLRHGASPARPKPAPRSLPVQQTPFVGRREEYHALYSVWEATVERRPQHALVWGETGTGKSALVSRVLSAASLDGAVVSRATCYELEHTIPYAALSSLLRELVHRPGASATHPDALADLADIVPAIRHHFPHLPATAHLHGESGRLKLTEAAIQLIGSVAEERPVVLAIDDFHLADDASLAVLQLILRRIEDQRVMIVFVGRREGVARSPNAARLMDAIVHLGVKVIHVGPLDESAGEEALDALLEGHRPSVTVRRAILRAAQGSPLALTLVVRDWTIHGSAAGALQLEAMTPEVATTERSWMYEQVIARTLQRLAPSSRPVVDLATVLGGRMNDISYYSALGISSAEAVGTLSVLVDCCILRDAGSGLEFVNDMVRTQLYLSMPHSTRRQLHGLVADALLGGKAEGIPGCGLELAWHLMRCGRIEQALPYLLSGAREAIDHGAAWEAERALASAAASPLNVAATAGRLLLAEALFEQGRESESRSIALVIEGSAPEWADDLRTAIAVAAMARVPEQPVDDACHSFQALVSLMQGGAGGRARAIAARGAALFSLKLGDARHARALLSAIDDMEWKEIDDIDRADLGYARATALYQLRSLGESEREAIRAIATLEKAHVVNATLLALYCGRGAIHCATGRYDDGLEILQTAFDIARRVGNVTIARACLSNLALCCFRLGDTKGQIYWGEMAQQWGRGLQATIGDATYLYHLAMGYALSGDAQRAFDAISAGDRCASSLTPSWARQAWLLGRADVLAVLGRHEEARRSGREAVGAKYPELLSDSRAGPYARWKAMTVDGSGEAVEVRRELFTLLRHPDRFDAVDHAEILAATILLGQLIGADVSNDAEDLRLALGQLPSAVGTTIRRLGFLEHARPLDASRKGRRRRKSAAKPTEDPGERRVLRRTPSG